MTDALKFWFAKQLVEFALFVGVIVLCVAIALYLDWRKTK